MTDEPDIEVTPEMVEAGADALCAHCDELSSKTDSTLEWLVGQVYEAMELVRLSKPSKGRD